MTKSRTWMYLPRRLPEYENGVIEFLIASFAKASVGDQIRCPCTRCRNRYWLQRHEVFDHLKALGFVQNYDVWCFHGEEQVTTDSIPTMDEGSFIDNIDEMLHDRFRSVDEGSHNVQNGLNDEAKNFYKLVEEGKQELFAGCKNFSKLSFIIRLLLFKTLQGLSIVAFDDLLKLLKDMVPEAKLPANLSASKSIVKDLGLHHKKIYSCPNDCMLYWKEYEHSEECHVCHTSKWKQLEDNENECNGSSKKRLRIPAKVLWHFPLKPRLQTLYMCSKSAGNMTWHDDKRLKDGYLRHPADGTAWKEFDSLYPSFANESRNVRLGLASDGFNPFRTMNINHSTWPMVLINYNLPPWMFMKSEYLLLSLLIPGPEGPGNNIDVYLQPLIEELQDLWDIWLETYDKARNETFVLHAALTWIISDFSGYSMLSGWKTKGNLACPICNHETDSLYLKHSRKMCYMNSRKFLHVNHPWRRNKKHFNGEVEERLPPRPLTGHDILEEVSDFVNSFGKKQKKTNKDCPWKKRPIFFKLKYWMHIQKNFCDNVLGTLLDIPGKYKDHAKARFDLLEFGINKTNVNVSYWQS